MQRLFHQAGRRLSSTTSRVSLQTLNGNVVKAQYAVRGSIAIRAEELEQQLKQPSGKNLPFDSVIKCNIGNPQSLKQKPLSFIRDVLSIAVNPSLVDRCSFPPDVVARASRYIKDVTSVGAYSTSAGSLAVREDVARFLEERDGYKADPNDIYLTNGASDGVKAMLQMFIREKELGFNDGILCPIPQYPLYSGSVALNNGHLLGYYLDESANWGISMAELDSAYAKAKAEGKTARALVIINPGNPTGGVMSEKDLRDVCVWCQKNEIVLMADEVYQENIWKDDVKFISMRKVAYDLNLFAGPKPLQLVSFHSVSKGFLGECGLRGGYLECLGFPADVMEQLYKLFSMALCSNVVGQLAVGLMVRPPQQGDASYDVYKTERDGILHGMKYRSKLLRSALNKLEGVSCVEIQGSMYAFPTITLPAKAVAAAQARGLAADLMYCHEMIEATGITVVAGSGFWQKDGTYHFRTTILPPDEQMKTVVERLSKFHREFLEKYK